MGSAPPLRFYWSSGQPKTPVCDPHKDSWVERCLTLSPLAAEGNPAKRKSGTSALRWILSEPLDDARHIRLKRPRRREVEHTSTNASSVLEVMPDSARHENERPFRTLDPLLAHADAHDAFDDIEEIVFGVRVSSRPLSSWLEPPLRYRIPRLSFFYVRLENSGDSAHRICTPLAWSQHDRLSWRPTRLAHSLFRL